MCRLAKKCFYWQIPKPVWRAREKKDTIHGRLSRFGRRESKTNIIAKIEKTVHAPFIARAVVAAASAALAFSCLTGCNAVKRRLTITSEPSGALVYLNDKEIGRTPISQNFTYSGSYKIRCLKEGYEMEETYYKAGTPWYLYPGIDFISENFVPGEIRDEQRCHVNLTPKRQVPELEIMEAANKLREEAHSDASIKRANAN